MRQETSQTGENAVDFISKKFPADPNQSNEINTDKEETISLFWDEPSDDSDDSRDQVSDDDIALSDQVQQLKMVQFVGRLKIQ